MAGDESIEPFKRWEDELKDIAGKTKTRIARDTKLYEYVISESEIK